MTECRCKDRWSGPCDACTPNQELPGMWEHADFIGGREDTKTDQCADVIRATFAERGGDVTVSTQPPIVQGPYETAAYTCPHGFTYFVEPTGEQIAQWAEDGTP